MYLTKIFRQNLAGVVFDNVATQLEQEERIIEYVMNAAATKKLIDFTVADFAEETASESMAPGGGSVAAYVGVLGVSLGTMVANLSAHKAGWDAQW